MKIVENIKYSVDDIIDAINDELGFAYIKTTDIKGYINLGGGIKLDIEFGEEDLELISSKIVFPSKEVDISESGTRADLYSSSIESSIQIVDIIKRMLGDVKSENFE